MVKRLENVSIMIDTQIFMIVFINSYMGISVRILMKHFPSVVAASGMTPDQLATMTWKGFLVNNLCPVTLGNIVGAFVFVVLLFWTAYLRDERRHHEQ